MSLRGTVRKQNEDRYVVEVCEGSGHHGEEEAVCETSNRVDAAPHNRPHLLAQVPTQKAEAGGPMAYVGVFDGHGGSATAQWLTSNLSAYLQKAWQQQTSPGT